MATDVSIREGVRQFYLQILRDTIAKKENPINTDFLEFSGIPESVRISKSAVYNDESIPGRSEPWKVYSYSSPTSISFTGIFFAQGKVSGNASIPGLGKGLGLLGRLQPDTAPFLGIAGNAASLVRSQFTKTEELISNLVSEVHAKAAWLEALVYPQTDRSGRVFPPPTVRIHHGANFNKTGVLKSFDFTYKGPWETNTILTYGLEADLVFEEVNAIPKNYNQVRNRKQAEPSAVAAKANIFETIGRDAVSLARSKIGL